MHTYICARRRTSETALGAADGWIAATAFLLDVPLVMHDRRLSRIEGIRVITALPDTR